MNIAAVKNAALLHPQEVLEPFDQIIEAVGIDPVFALAEHFGGQTIYIPSAKSIFFRCVELEAAKEYTGKNTISLAKKYGFSERHMRRLVGKA